jgi:Putative transposase
VLQGVVVRILLRTIERCLREHSPGSGTAARLGAVVFIHRFGSALNARLHFHSYIMDGGLPHSLLLAESTHSVVLPQS